jgi:hypothetical protein
VAGAPGVLVSVAAHGAAPNGDDAGPGVKRALAALPRIGGTLFFPPGRYHFRQHGGFAITLQDFERLTLDATDATFLFERNTSPILMARCTAPVLRGFTIDFERPPFSQGDVLAVAPDGRSFDVRIDPEFPVDGTEPIQTLGTYDRAAVLNSRNGLDTYGIGKSSTLIGVQTLRISTNYALPRLKPGDVVVLRHNVYGNHSIVMNGCKSPRISDVTIHAGGGMGVVGGQNDQVLIERLRILPTPGSHRLMSICADGVHLGHSTGTVTITDCLMAAMGDDCININNSYLRVAGRIDARTLIVSKYANQPFSPLEASMASTRVGFASGHTLAPIGEATISSSEVARDRETLHFQSDLPPDLQPGDVLSNLSSRATLSVSRCNFPGNRARGILAHANATIQNCYFANQTSDAILLAPDVSWLEGPEAAQVSIVDNKMIDVQRGGGGRGAIRITVAVPAGNSAGFVDHNIDISGNHIIGPGPALVADHVRQLSFTDNRIERTDGPAVEFGPVRGVTLVRNVCTPAAPVVIDSASRSEVKFESNQGLVR